MLRLTVTLAAEHGPREDGPPSNLRETVAGVEVVTSLPTVTEVLPGTPDIARPLPLEWKNAPVKAAMASAFLRLCSAGGDYRLSRLADTAITMAAMHVLRLRLHAALSSKKNEALAPYCEALPGQDGGWRVRWHPGLVQYLARSSETPSATAAGAPGDSHFVLAEVPVSSTSLPLAHQLSKDFAPLFGPKATTSLHVTVHTLADLPQLPSDVEVTSRLVSALWSDYIVPAEGHRVDGGDAIAYDAPKEALEEYERCTARAQAGVCFAYEHPVRPEKPTYPDSSEATDSHYRIYGELEALPHAGAGGDPHTIATDGGAAALRLLYAPLMIPGDDYYSEVLLRVQLDPSVLVTEIESSPVVAPAVAAMSWRARKHLPSATTLQLLQYTLQRLLVVGVANVAHTALLVVKGHQQLGGHRTLTEYAAACDKASSLTLSLVRFHGLLSRNTTDQCDTAPAAQEETLWCLRMYCKLRLRLARLYAEMGDRGGHRRVQQELQSTLERWNRLQSCGHGASAGASVLEGLLPYLPVDCLEQLTNSVQQALKVPGFQLPTRP